MIITKEDIGRKVVDGFGNIETIVRFDPDGPYPIKTAGYSYTTTGKWLMDCTDDSLADLVGFVDEEK